MNRRMRRDQTGLAGALVRWLRQHPKAGPYLRTGAIAVFLAGSMVAFAIVLIGQSTTSSASVTQTPIQGVANSTTEPGNATPNPRWVSVKSTQSDDIIAAARATTTFQNVLAAHTSLGNALRTGTLGTPTLVHAYRPVPGMLDTWVIPVRQGANGQVVALLDFAYDTATKSMHATSFAGPFAPGDPLYGQPFPRMTMQNALSQAQNKRQVSEMAGAQPQLIYFPIDLDKTTGPHATVHWTAGGQFADTAIWLVHGSDAKDYFVGNDGQVYTPDQLPLSPQAAK